MSGGPDSCPADVSSIVPWLSDDLTHAEIFIKLREYDEANKRPDGSQEQFRFSHPELLELPEKCQYSLLVHGHRTGLVRFEKLLWTFNGYTYSHLTPCTEATEIVERVQKLHADTAGVTKAADARMADILQKLTKKMKNLVSTIGMPDSKDVKALEGFMSFKQEVQEEIYLEECQAAAAYVTFMLPRQIK